MEDNNSVIQEKHPQNKNPDITKNIKSINRDIKIISNSLEKINKNSLEQDKVCQCVIL
jgi:hypothetical protein